MPEYLRPARAAGFDAVINWQITGAGGTGRQVDEYWLHVHDGRCTPLPPQPTPPDIAIRTDPTTLLRIVTGNEDPILALLKQRLTVRGDLAAAARLPKLFTTGPT
ncbi:SCP2 sterol-binding domain-containing protein [Kribbella sp. GL6]|uniref:SCP2 sterol-binding domain-containing protein n=1 Tax=Kribbella sp. GL6 TaxID=3419765 RepID=UPI003D0311DA